MLKSDDVSYPRLADPDVSRLNSTEARPVVRLRRYCRQPRDNHLNNVYGRTHWSHRPVYLLSRSSENDEWLEAQRSRLQLSE